VSFVSSLAAEELGAPSRDFVIVDEFEAGPGSAVMAAAGTPHAPGASDFVAIFRAHESELLG
jgi:hypothetical protein